MAIKLEVGARAVGGSRRRWQPPSVSAAVAAAAVMAAAVGAATAEAAAVGAAAVVAAAVGAAAVR